MTCPIHTHNRVICACECECMFAFECGSVINWWLVEDLTLPSPEDSWMTVRFVGELLMREHLSLKFHHTTAHAGATWWQWLLSGSLPSQHAAGEEHISVDAAQSSSASIINSRLCQRNWDTSLASMCWRYLSLLTREMNAALNPSLQCTCKTNATKHGISI